MTCYIKLNDDNNILDNVIISQLYWLCVSSNHHSHTLMKFIFIDGSYFIFFRFNALKSWWSLAHRDEGELIPDENEAFKDKFRKTFAEKLKEIPKKVGIKKGEAYRIYVGQDCRQENIWRMAHYDGYKDGRADTTTEGKFFKMVYEEKMFEATLGDECLLRYPALEADDVIAISVQYICEKSSTDECYIISSDGDYLQMCGESRIHIYDLKFKDIRTRDIAYSQPDTTAKMFLVKRMCGDKSDNIPAVFPKCGKKTAMNMIDAVNGNEAELMLAIEKRGGVKAVEQYKFNDKMMNFDRIPHELRSGFITLACKKFA